MDPKRYKKKSVVETYDMDRFKAVPWHKKMFNRTEEWFFTENLKKGSILDVGCGTGRLAFLAKYTGVDFSKEMIKKARKKYPSKKFKFGDARKLPFKNNSFDNVIALRVFLHMKDWKRALSEMLRVCKPGGHIIFDVRLKGILSLKSKKHKINLISVEELPKYKKIFFYPPILRMGAFVVIKK